jgi:hypothetical protein
MTVVDFAKFAQHARRRRESSWSGTFSEAKARPASLPDAGSAARGPAKYGMTAATDLKAASSRTSSCPMSSACRSSSSQPNPMTR